MHITSTNMHGWWQYQIWVDHKIYSTFDWKGSPLTLSQEVDVLNGYREGLSW